jgi:hypothetical protein
VSQALGQAGITLTLASPLDIIEGAKASRAIGGLIVGFAPKALREAVAALPSPAREAVQDNVPMDQTVFLSIGGVVVSSSAVAPFVVGAPPVEIPAGGSVGSEEVSEAPAAPSDVGAEPAPAVAPGQLPIDGRPVADFGFNGLPVLVGVLALLIALASSRPLVWAADKALARRAAATCPNDR